MSTVRRDSRKSTESSQWQAILGVIGALAIVAFHTGVPGAAIGWAAVEIFFVLAGMRMVSAMERDDSVSTYLKKRVHRLGPEIAVIWLVTLGIVIVGRATVGQCWFAATAPFFMQNLSVAFFDYRMPADALFGPLWFTASLVQMQVLCLLAGKWMLRLPTFKLIAMACLTGCGLRACFSVAYGSLFRLDSASAGVLYCMPFCHLEALILGILIGRGALTFLSRLCIPILLMTAAAGALNALATDHRTTWAAIGFVFPLRENASAIWGYPLLALAAAAVCAVHHRMDAWFARLSLVAKCRGMIDFLSGHSYGIYCFHGAIIASGIAGWFATGKEKVDHLLAFVIILVLSLMASILVRLTWKRLERLSARA